MGKRYEVRWGATLIGMAENQSRVTSLKRAAKLLGAKPRQVTVIDHGPCEAPRAAAASD